MTISQEQALEIRRLHFAEHWPVGTIGRQLGHHDDVVRRAVGLPEGNAAARSEFPRPRILDAYLEFVKETLQQYPTLRATRVYDMIRDRGYTGSVRRLRELIVDLQLRPRPKNEAFARLEFLIGEQAQVDWMHVGDLAFGATKRAIWAFVIVLSWSRAMWAELVIDLTAASLARSLVRSARFFGGVTRQWLFDNPKIVVLQREGDAVRFHPQLLAVTGSYNVAPRLCAIRKANQKGRVERTNRYLRERHFAGRTVSSIEQGNLELLRFIETIAHARPHPEFPGRTVAECFEEERARLLPQPEQEPNTDLIRPVYVDKTGYVCFDRNFYAAPGRNDCTVTLAADDHTVRFVDGAEEVARHLRVWGAKARVGQLRNERVVAETKPRIREAAGRTRLRAATPRIDAVIERWVAAGRNVGSMVAQSLRLLDLYGAETFAHAVDGLLERGTNDPGALAVLCEHRRTALSAPVPVGLVLGNHVPERDVIPNDLGVYDVRR